jgi:GntR family transcriptional repressor for pyruvate dehydrogenase complex
VVAKLAVENATDDDIAYLESLLEQAEKAGLKDRKIGMRVDHDFHIALANATGNEVLAEVVSFVKKRSSMLWSRNVVTEKQVKAVQTEHRKIVNAIKNRDVKKAVAAMTAHVGNLKDAVF